MPSDRRTSWMVRLGIVAGYAALAVALTWPLAKTPFGHLPMGTEHVVSVPALNAWTVWWNADRARYAFADYWHAPIFYPAKHAFAFSEAQPTTLVVAPLVAVSPAFAYNVYLLAVLTLNGLVAYRLLRRVGTALVPAVLGGVIVEALPIVHWQLGVLQLTTICGVLWVIDRLVALRDGRAVEGPKRRGGEKATAAATAVSSQRLVSPSPPVSLSPSPGKARRPPLRVTDALLLGVAAALCYAACNYFGLFLSALLPLSFLPLVWGRWLDWRFWALLAASGVIAAGLSTPILWAQYVAKTEYKWTREESLLYQLSARPRDYVNPYHHNPYLRSLLDLPKLKDPNRNLWNLGTGTFKLGLAAAGVVAGLLMRGRRRWTLFLVLFGGWAFVLSLGLMLEVVDGPTPRLRNSWDEPVTGWLPYRLLTAAHPGLALARSPFRFAFFVHLAVALLAANALDGLWAAGRRLTRGWNPRARVAGVGLTAAVVVAAAGLAAAEVVPTRQRLYEMTSLDQAWIGWVKENIDPERPAIVCLPFPMGATVDDYEATALFMWEQIGHRRPMADGYSGFFPKSFVDLKMAMSDFPAEATIHQLRTRKVGHVVSAAPDWTALAGQSPSLRLVFRDEDANVSVFQVLSPVDDDGRTPPP